MGCQLLGRLLFICGLRAIPKARTILPKYLHSLSDGLRHATDKRLRNGLCRTERNPFSSRVPEECPEDAVELVRRCLRLNPQERPTAAEAAEAIHVLAAAAAHRMQARRRTLQLYWCLVPAVWSQD